MKYNQPFYVPIGKGKVNLHTGQRGGYYLPALELDIEEVRKDASLMPIEAKRLWGKVQQLESEVVGWRKKHAEALKEIDILKAKVDRGTKKYKF